MKRPVCLVLGYLLVGSLSVWSAPLQRADVPADATGVLHLDCDALRRTYFGKYLLYQLNKPELCSNMLAFQSIFSFDIRTQLHGLTVYTVGPKPEENVTILYADLVPERIIALIKPLSFETFTAGRRVIYSWVATNRTGELQPRVFAIFEKGRAITSQSKFRLKAALSVLDDPSVSLATSREWPELGLETSGQFVQGRAQKLNYNNSDPNAALLRYARQVRIHAEENDEQLTARLALETVDESTARQLAVVAQGIMAMLSLQKDNPTVALVASDVSVTHQDTLVSVAARVPSRALIAALKADSDRAAK